MDDRRHNLCTCVLPARSVTVVAVTQVVRREPAQKGTFNATYFSCRPSRRELCEPGIRSCTAAIRTAPTRPTGASRCCPPASWIWRRWSRRGCPRARKKTSAAPLHHCQHSQQSRSVVINTYVSCLMNNVNKHIIIHPVSLTTGPETSHTAAENFFPTEHMSHIAVHCWSHTFTERRGSAVKARTVFSSLSLTGSSLWIKRVTPPHEEGCRHATLPGTLWS